VYLLFIIPLIVFFAIIIPGHRWHHGFCFIFNIVSIRLIYGKLDSAARPRIYSLTIILLIQGCVGLYSLGLDVFTPYSNGQRVARYIKEKKLEGLPIVSVAFRKSPYGNMCTWDTGRIQSVLMELPGKQVFNLEIGDPQRLHIYRIHGAIQEFSCSTLAERVHNLAVKFGSPLLVAVCSDFGQMPVVDLEKLDLLLPGVPVLDFGETISLYEHQIVQASNNYRINDGMHQQVIVPLGLVS